MNSGNDNHPAPVDLHLPKGLLVTAGILMVLAEPVWLTIDRQIFLSTVVAAKPFHFNVLLAFSLFNALLGTVLLSIRYLPWLQLRWRTVTWLVWASLIL